MRALITGASGFAGGWLAEACANAGDEVVAVSRSGSVPRPAGGGRTVALDLRDALGLRELFASVRPEVVYHLAALSSVGRSWEDPQRTLQENAASALSVLEAIRHETPGARIVWVSSCEVYGVPDALPLREDAPVRPANPYAVSKAGAEMLAGVYADAYGLDLIRARPFSHSGPGQRPIFLLSSLARQAAIGLHEGAVPLRLVTGNPDTRRDFTDVRDVVRAYRLLAERAPAGIYNVSSGTSVSAAEQVALIAQHLRPIEVIHAVDPARVRAYEVMDLRGDSTRLRTTTGWAPELSLHTTITDTISWWQGQSGLT